MAHSTRPGASRRIGTRRLHGFTLIELAIAASVLTVITVMAAGKLVQEINDAAAVATGAYLLTLKGAMDSYLVNNYDPLAGQPGTSVADVSIALAPTLVELRRLGFLQPGFPDRTPFNQRVAVRIERSGQCPGAQCRLDALIYTTSPLQLPGSIEPDIDLIAQVVMSGAGYVGASYATAAATMRGTSFSTTNPLGAVAGIVGAMASLDTTIFNRFVRMRDRRDPDLQGGLTVQGAIDTHQRVTVRDSDGNPCVTADKAGLVSIQCAGQLNAKTGVFTTDSGDVVAISPTTGVITNQRVRASQGLATDKGTVFDASDAQPTIRVAAGQMLLATRNGLALTLDGQDIVGHAGVSASRLGLREVAVVNMPCTGTVSALAGANAEFARTAQGGLLVCASGTWRSLASIAALGTACTPNGALATDEANGTGLVCRLGVWARVDDMLSSYVLVSTLLVNHASMVPKPACGPLGSAAGTPLIYLIAQIESSKGSAFTRRAQDLGAAWSIQLLDYDGTPLAGPATAIAHVYCKY